MDRFNFRIWNKQENKYLDGIFAVARSGRLIIDLDILQDYDYSNDYIIEQCTGLSDKNGNLIYEGDIVKDEVGIEFTIIWSEEDCMFDGRILYYNPEVGDRYDLYQGATDNSEIIGNIHEQAEQKD